METIQPILIKYHSRYVNFESRPSVFEVMDIFEILGDLVKLGLVDDITTKVKLLNTIKKLTVDEKVVAR